MRRFVWVLAGLADLWVCVQPAYAGTCALCRQALASGGNEGLIRGFYFSILLVAGMPLLIFAIVAVRGWRAWRARP